MDLTKKSIEVLKSLQLKNGAILATPIDGAYNYVYPRDAVFVTKAFNKVGLYKNSEKFYYFLKEMGRVHYFKEVFHRYNYDGLPAVTRNHEHDNSPLVVHGIYDAYLHGKNKKFLLDMWPLVNLCIKNIFKNLKSNGLVKTERSIHEFYRLENGFEIWVNCAACRALHDAAEIVKILNINEDGNWALTAKNLKINIMKKFYDKKRGIYMKNLRFPEISDIAQLSPFYFGLDNSKPILRRTLAYLKKNIWYVELGGFRRFKKFEINKDWHWYSGGSGSWLVLTLWGARFYKQLGDKKGYKECMDFVKMVGKYSGGLLPEHVAVRWEYDLWKKNEIEFNKRVVNGMKKSEKLNEEVKKKYGIDIVHWAIPLGWSHAEYILTVKGT